MKKSRLLVLVSIILVLSFALSACAAPSAPATPPPATEPTEPPAGADAPSDEAAAGETITVIFPKHEADVKGAFEARIQEFEQASGIQVNLIQSDWDSVANRVVPELATKGSAYDVVEFDNGWVAEWCGAGWVSPLNEFMPADYTKDMIPGLVDLFSCNDGQLYGIGWNNDTRFFYYNEAILKEAGFTEPPATWDELVTQSKEAVAKGLVKFGLAPYWNQEWSLANELFFYTSVFGGKLIDEKGCLMMNEDPNTEKAVQFLVDMLADGVADPAGLTYNQAASQDVFLKGGSIFMPQGIGGLMAYTADETISSVSGKINTGLVPKTDTGTGIALTLPEAYAIPVGSQHKEAAWKFIEFMTSKDTNRYLAKEIGALPIWVDLFSDPELVGLYPYWADFQAQLSSAVGLPKVTWYSDFVDISNAEFHKALAGEQTPKEALDNMASQLSQYNCVP